MYDLTEFKALVNGLIDKNISFTVKPLYDGYQVLTDSWDAIIHGLSMGCKQGLLEIWGSITKPDLDSKIEGWLRADEILSRL